MLNPFVDLLATVISLYMYCVIAWAVMSTLISLNIVNKHQEVVRNVMYALNRLCGPVLWRIRKFMPDLGAIDLSPIVLILLLGFARNVLYAYFYDMGHWG